MLLALRVATGVAFVLAGLVNVFLEDRGTTFFVHAGYTRTLRLFVLTAEVLGGAALLLPWRWLTLTAAAGLAIDVFGALATQIRVGEPPAQLAAALAAWRPRRPDARREPPPLDGAGGRRGPRRGGGAPRRTGAARSR